MLVVAVVVVVVAVVVTVVGGVVFFLRKGMKFVDLISVSRFAATFRGLGVMTPMWGNDPHVGL